MTWIVFHIPDILDLIYDVCKYDFALLDNDAWCDVFSRRNLKTLEYSQDIKYYWRYGYGLEINYKQTCLLVKDILNSLRWVIFTKFMTKNE